MKSFWQPIIGIEVHFELKTKSKMFCPCPANHFGKKPNSQICPVCLGLPGALPVPNREAIEKTLLMALALNCRITSPSYFDRKNYFYPDLPKGYQISQHFAPLGRHGRVEILLQGKFLRIEIREIHLEEDTAKLIHRPGKTLIDFNRSGVPLVEVVSAPVLHTPLAAKLYLKRIQQLVRWLEISDGDMEKGSMRCEANISVAKLSSTSASLKKLPPYRVEIKNINSFRFVERALEYEIERQIKLLEKGKRPSQETRGFDPARGVTFPQRSKETAPDYRYFPEPDIPPFEIKPSQKKQLKDKIPPLPWEEERNLIEKWKIKPSFAEILVREKDRLAFLKKILPRLEKEDLSAPELANLLVNRKVSFKDQTIKEFLKMIREKKKKNLDEKTLKQIVNEVVAAHPKAVADFKKGKTAVIGFFIGQVQKQTQGQADPQQTAQLIRKRLER